MIRWMEIELLSDVVLTARWATSGGHESLDYLPGSLFLGIVAARWKPFDPAAFLGGGLRFSDGLPLGPKGALAFPVPLSFHLGKGVERGAPHNGLDETFRARGPDAEPRRQVRDGHVLENGVRVLAGRRYRLKTARDRDTFGCARDGQLFGYQSLDAGSRFMMAIESENREWVDRAAGLIEGPIAIGRSRSAEYGRAVARRATPEPALPGPMPDGGTVVLYLVSDLALARDGVPALDPRAGDFGIGNARLDPDRTFLRTRRYSPWNAFHNRHMAERQVIRRGSVLTFNCDVAPTADELRSLQNRLAAGVGLHASEGLGRILVNPGFVLRPPALSSVDAEPPAGAALPRTRLAEYLVAKSEVAAVRLESMKLGVEWATELRKVQKAVADENDGVAPGKSQWGGIRQCAARAGGDVGALTGLLAEFCTQGDGETYDGRSRGSRRKFWTSESGRGTSLHETMLGLIKTEAKRPDAAASRRAVLALLYASVEMSRHLARKGEDGEA